MTFWLLLIGIPLLLGLWAQGRVSGAFGTWRKVRASSNLSGAEAARKILDAANLYGVEVVRINGLLGDHYDPKTKRLCLSSEVFDRPSVAAIGIAAHECGHAIQDAQAYAPLKMRMSLIPVTQLASSLLPFAFLAGMIFAPIRELAYIAAILFVVLSVFQLVTLPAEYDATRRAKKVLEGLKIAEPGEETRGVAQVLDAAALTYVAAFVGAIGSMGYFVSSIFGGKR